MPYRYAHYVILFALLPAIGLAFWPGYFGTLATAPFALHAHGVTASIWVLLVAGQSWTAHARRFAWHRVVARAVLVVGPLFAAAAALVVHSMAIKYVTKADPFDAALGARLGMDDIVTTIAFVWMIRAAIRHRRRVGVHAAYMLSTVILVLPPVIARLPIPEPLLTSYGVTIGVPLLLYAFRRRDGFPFLITAAIVVIRIALFGTIADSAGWAALFSRIATIPAPVLASLAFAAAAAAIWTVWPWPPRRVASAAV